MNYYITHCDKNFLIYAERLFETLSFFSENKIIFYTIDFDYKSKYKNVIPIKLDSKNHIESLVNYKLHSNDAEAFKAYHVFLKPFIIKNILTNDKYKNHNFCYLDSDCLALSNCDQIFLKINNIIDYPLFNKCCHDFMLMNGRGDPFINNTCDLNLTLEGDLMKLLNIDLTLRKQYLQTGVFLFNSKCLNFINEWCSTCFIPEIVKNWKTLTPFHEETVANCLLWKKQNLIDLSQSLINIPYNVYNYDLSFTKIEQMVECLNNIKDEKYFIDTFCLIPAKQDLKNLFFYHGKISDDEYNFIKDTMTNNYLLKINSQSLGDTIAVTPTLRKLYNSYNKKIDIITYHPDLFTKNKYVNNIYSFNDKVNEKIYKEIFNTFLGVGGEKNKYGVEKKHNTIDIRQYHAIDLGFMLNDTEMEYDYISDEYVTINDLPEKYICLHVANTWPSRTYSDQNWQILINKFNEIDIPVVLIGKNGHETGFFNVDKPTKKLNFKLGLDLTNKLSISQCWHIINKSDYFITMDSGLLHLAGTTDTNIIQLGSSINYKLRAPYRKNSQSYKYKYISGSCNVFCASDIKYGVKEWKTIQGIPPLINCLENKNVFECHPDPIYVFNEIIEDKSSLTNKKFLFITPHLSTGGSPKYLEWLIKSKINEGYNIKVVEWNLYSDIYTIQRDSIIKLIGENNFYSVGRYCEDDEFFYNKTKDVISYIKEFNPNYIHLNEFSEHFALKNLSSDLIQYLYDKNRSFKLYETTHSAQTKILNKKNIPDELWLVSDYQYQLSKQSNIKSILVEMQIKNKIRPNRNETLISLGLDPNKMHVLQVGLFSKNKNQKFTFTVADQLINKNVQFHFIGNECFINECELNKDQKNCKIWGERSDVDLFMSCMDLFVMPSIEELNPIALKEALSWNLKCFVSDLYTIKDQYKNDKNIIFIKDNNLVDYINSNLSSNITTNRFNIDSENSEDNNIVCTFYPNPKIEILGSHEILYHVEFIDELTDKIHYKSYLRTNQWVACSITYFCKWKIIVKNLQSNTVKIYRLDLNNKLVKIINESNSLGDSICWMAMVNEFQKKYNCIVDYYTAKKDLFLNEYPNINFYDYSDLKEKHYYVEYKIGCFDIKNNSNSVKTDWRKLKLQEIASVALGLEYSEKKTRIRIPNKYKHEYKKYICIATQSTSQSRYWNNKNGWFEVVNYLKSKGYKVICVDKHFSFGDKNHSNICPINIDYFAGHHSLDEIIDIINNCEFFIGLSSGLSWLAWALNKKIIKINGSVHHSFEFHTPYLIQNKNVCNSCFANEKYTFDASNWAWCPENKNFECSSSIAVDKVIEQIDIIINESQNKLKKFKIIHLQTNIDSDGEKKSKAFIEKFNEYGLTYVNYRNELYNGDDYHKNCAYPDLLKIDGPDKLTNRHYGCFNSYKNAIIEQFNDDFDYIILCEGDCLFEMDHKSYIEILHKITDICDSNDINYFSFGDTKTLENRVTQSEFISKPDNQDLCFITNKIIGIQCIMFSKKIKDLLINDFKNQPWYIADGWFNEFCWRNNIKMGILFNRITSQYSGESYIDKKHKNFNN